MKYTPELPAKIKAANKVKAKYYLARGRGPVALDKIFFSESKPAGMRRLHLHLASGDVYKIFLPNFDGDIQDENFKSLLN